MASNPGQIPQNKPPTFGRLGTPNTSLLIEKTKAAMRRSTPDSEALASSDDEVDHGRRPTDSGLRNSRRPSWAIDNGQTAKRKPSSGALDASGTAYAGHSADGNYWAGSGHGHSTSSSLPWNNTIWNNEGQRTLPPRFSEVLPSPTSNITHKLSQEELISSPQIRRGSHSETGIPFPIPLHPTIKSYRSQSYSVGQSDQEAASNASGWPNQSHFGGRTRAGSSYAGLHHRPSRPSILGDMSGDGPVLEQLREVDDDQESQASSEAGYRMTSSQAQARTIEQLAMENAILRQQAMANQQQATSGYHQGNYGAQFSPFRQARGVHINDSVLEEPDDMSAGGDEYTGKLGKEKMGPSARRMSEYSSSFDNPFLLNSGVDKASVDGKKAQWQSSLGFGKEGNQSRRHSFADVSFRRPSMGTLVEPSGPVLSEEPASEIPDGNYHGKVIDNGLYHSSPHARTPDIHRPIESQSPNQHGNAAYHAGTQAYYGSPKTPHNQSLYVVTFKAARAEFYYVQEGTGLQVNPGDLVIVEADRGTDLGTVEHKNVDWARARELKEHYAVEHYNWLMMFSRHGQNVPGAANMNSATGFNRPGSGKGAPHGGLNQQMTNSTESLNMDIKPKMIKRLAQQHEIHTLKEKEGNEAKAKRMCQQKVAEHQLNMEILDAEFQMDWKKLTFYYFADSYINFNSLVTDLFKIYKTRIWMSAINPASFASSTVGLQLPSPYQPAVPAIEHDHLADTRGNFGDYAYMPPNSSIAAMQNQWNAPLNPATYAAYWNAGSYSGMPPAGIQKKPSNSQFAPYMQFVSPQYGPQSGPQGQSKREDDDIPQSPHSDAIQGFQSLSLGTH